MSRVLNASYHLTLLLAALVGCSNKPPSHADGGAGSDAGAGQAGSSDGAGTGGMVSEGGAASGGSGTVDVVSGSARRLALGTEYGCALDTTDAVVCWGSPTLDDGQTKPPKGPFKHVRGYGSSNCAFGEGHDFECWGAPFGYAKGSKATDIGISTRHGCILGTDGTIACAGDTTRPEAMPPTGTFRAVAAAPGRSCAIKPDGTLTCWGISGADGHLDAPAGKYSKLALGEFNECAIREGDGQVVCWGAGKDGDPNGADPQGNYWGQSIPPAGAFADICAGLFHTCGIRADGTLACWGRGTQTNNCQTTGECGQAAPPAGTFWEVDCGATHTCAVAQDGSVSCWGSNSSDRATPPAGLRAR